MKKVLKKLLAIAITISILLQALPLSYASATNTKDDKSNINSPAKRVLVKYKDNAKKSLKKRLQADTKKQRNFKKIYGEKIELMSIDSEDEESFRLDSEVELVEEDGIVQKSDDEITWNIDYINAHLAQENGYNGSGVKVAIFDTGIDSNCTDLNVVGGVSFVDDVTSYSDDNGHGTAMAGILAATRNNSGLIGVAPDINLYSVKVLDRNGTGTYSNIIEGIHWAIENNIDIISMSFGGTQYSQILEEVINEAYNNNILIIAASGNDSSSNINYPAKYNKTICVGAVDSTGNVSTFSNYGSEMDLVAPGVNVETTTINNATINVSGTSPAVPHVAGVAAQIISANRDLSLDEVKAILYKSAVPIYGMSKEKYGWGVVSSYNSMENIHAGLVLDEATSQVEFVGYDSGTDGTVNMSFIIYGNQTIFIGQSATVRAGFFSPHELLTITVENQSGSVIYSETRSPIGGNGAYVTFTAPSYLFGAAGTYHIRYHCSDNQNSSYDDVFAINVVPAASGTPRSVSFGESTNQSQSQIISIPNINSITGITVDNGSVGYGINGNNVSINVSGGSPTRTTGQFITDFRESTTNSFSDSVPYNNGDCNGSLIKNGSSYVSGQSPPDNKTITNYSVNTGTTYPSSTYSYSSNGYTGTLSRSSVSDNGRYEDRGSYQQQSQYFTDSHTNVCTTVYKRPTKTSSWTLYSDTQSSPAPSSKPVNSNGYVGSIPRTTTTQNYRNESFSSDGLTWTITASYTANYGGTLYKTVWVPNNVWVSNYTGYYSGTATKPGATLYRQNYSGTIYGFTPYYYSYNVMLYYTTTADTQAPTAPNLVKNSQSSSSIELKWSGSTDNFGVAGYYIYRNGAYLNTTSSLSYTDNISSLPTGNYQYTVKAYDAAGNISTASNPLNIEITTPDDFGNDYNSASTIELGSEINGGINFAGDSDWFKFVPSSSGSYYFYTTGSTNTYGHLYDNNVNQLSYNDDCEDDLNFVIKQDLIADQTYYVKVRHSNSSGIGNYTLRIEKEFVTWYKFVINNKELYIKEPIDEDSNLEALVCNIGSIDGYIYSYVGDNWVNTNTIAAIPSDGGVIAASLFDSIKKRIKIEDILRVVNIIASIVNVASSCFPFDIFTMTSEDWNMAKLGISTGLVDSVFPKFGVMHLLINNATVKKLIFLTAGISESEAHNNYYYIRSKMGTEYCIMIAARVAEAGSEAAAAIALANAGITFTGGLVTFASTGGLGAPIAIAVEVESAVSLTTAGVLAIAGVAVGKVANNAEDAFKNDANKIREASDEAITGDEAISTELTRTGNNLENTAWRGTKVVNGETVVDDVGAFGEHIAQDMLSQNGWGNFKYIKNGSDNGIDIIAQASDGHWGFFEVKTSSTGSIPNLTPRQANMDDFVNDILYNAKEGIGRYQNIDTATQDFAEFVYNAYKRHPYDFSGNVIGVDLLSGLIRVCRWAR